MFFAVTGGERLKVLIFIDDLLCGGTEAVLASRLANLSSGTEAHVATLYAEGLAAETIRALGIKVECLGAGDIGRLKTIAKARDIERQLHPDVSVCMRSVARGLLPFSLKGKVAMFWDHPIIRTSPRQAMAEAFQVRFAGARMYCCSNATRAALLKIYPGREIAVIPNCYNTTLFSPVKTTRGNDRKKKVKIISVGNMRREKNHLDKLRVAKILKREKVDFSMEIIGHGDSRELHGAIADYKLEGMVEIVPGSKDIPAKLHNSDIFLFTSLSEGFPVSLLEAMACALPCVSYHFPGIEEIDSTLDSLELVRHPGDTEAMAARIINLASDPGKRKNLGLKAAELVRESFSAKKNTAEWEEFLKKTVSS